MTEVMKTLGVRKLYEHQIKPLDAVYNGNDIIVRYPTASGKSLIGQVPALADGTGYSIVISPLLALQKDQTDKLAASGITAYLLNSEVGAVDRKILLGQMSRGIGRTLIFMAPEQFVKQDVREALAQGGCRRIIVDEAHLILNATEKYRPEFMQLGEVIDELPQKPQIIALTATITPSGIETVKEVLRCSDAELFSLPVRRKNLHIEMFRLSGEDYHGKLCRAVRIRLEEKKLSGKTIIYCRTRKDTEHIYKFLKLKKYKVVMIHGGTGRTDREKRQAKFAAGKAKIMVATTAFGLGIDIPNVRLIIHAGLPLTFDGYIQEIGRAGRDGKAAHCCLVYHDGDFGRNENILAKGKSREEAVQQVALMRKAVESDTCIWKIVGKHFKDPKGKACGRCPACRRKATAF